MTAPAPPGVDAAIQAFFHCHAEILRQCAALSAAATGDLRELPAAIAFMEREVGPHHREEEAMLFPRLYALPLPGPDRAALHALLDALTADHRMLEDLWLALRGRLVGQAIVQDEALAADLETFAACSRQHLKREEAGLLPIMKRHLGVAPLATMSPPPAFLRNVPPAR